MPPGRASGFPDALMVFFTYDYSAINTLLINS
nr:MAG TPA_asm: hypothetical protein [Caudoviricetes sp.]